MIEIKNINKKYKTKGEIIKPVDGISLTFPEKGLITLFGPSGCGKTTLLNLIGGLDKPDSGEIIIDNQTFSKKNLNKFEKYRKNNISYIFQNYSLLEEEFIYYNLEINLRNLNISDKEYISQRIATILNLVNMTKFANKKVKDLSNGQKQRIAIARALASDSNIILADEPTGNLDKKNTLDIINILKEISKEKLVILVTHDKNIANEFSDRIIKLIDGKVTSDNALENQKNFKDLKFVKIDKNKVEKKSRLFNNKECFKYAFYNFFNPKNKKTKFANFNLFLLGFIFAILSTFFINYLAAKIRVKNLYSSNLCYIKSANYNEIKKYVDDPNYSVNLSDSQGVNEIINLSMKTVNEQEWLKLGEEFSLSNIINRVGSKKQFYFSESILGENTLKKDEVIISSELANRIIKYNQFKVGVNKKEDLINRKLTFRASRYHNFYNDFIIKKITKSKDLIIYINDELYQEDLKKYLIDSVSYSAGDILENSSFLKKESNSIGKIISFDKSDASIDDLNTNLEIKHKNAYESHWIIKAYVRKDILLAEIKQSVEDFEFPADTFTSGKTLTEILGYKKDYYIHFFGDVYCKIEGIYEKGDTFYAFKSDSVDKLIQQKFNEYAEMQYTLVLKNANATNKLYNENLQQFHNQGYNSDKINEKIMTYSIVLSVLLFLTSLIFYFVYKAEYLKKVKDITVMRQISIPKKLFYRKHLISTSVRHLLTSFLGFLIGALVILIAIKTAPEFLCIETTNFIFIIIPYFIFLGLSLLFSILPIIKTLKKTPYELSRTYDV